MCGTCHGKSGDYARFKFAPNLATKNIKGKQYPQDYNVKAVQLKCVDAGDIVYRQSGRSQSMVKDAMRAGGYNPGIPGYLDEEVPEEGSTPVAWKKYGDGWVGWLGDVNNEEETRKLILIVCGL